MCRKFGFAQPRRQLLGPRAHHHYTIGSTRRPLTALGKTELRLARANQFDINFGQDLGIK
jgi:hypothetical protein